MLLVDVNVWVAMTFQRHVGHAAAIAWFQSAASTCCFCRLTQLGFLRIASNQSIMGQAAVTMMDAWRAYDTLFADPKVGYLEEPVGIETKLRTLTQAATFSPKAWNDAYLAAFAELAGLEVVTFDNGFSSFTSARCTILN